MSVAVRLYHQAKSCLGRRLGDDASRLVLSLFFKAVFGIQRVFHFDSVEDTGLAILMGGKKVLGRKVLGRLVRAAPVRGVLRLVKRTEPQWHRGDGVDVSIDEHAVPRFTRKFSIRKGFHTIRNKKMKVEKLFYTFCVHARKLASLVVTRGNGRLASVSQKLLPPLRRRLRGQTLRVILDAGAAQNHDELLKVACHPNQVTIVRVPRRRAYRTAWEKLPSTAWERLEEPGPYKAAPPKVIHIAQTTTHLKGKKAEVDVRTVVVREEKARAKERWHALWVFGDMTTPAYMLVQEFRTRQQHEQTHRKLLHDLFVDTALSGYDKRSPNLKRPGFKQNALTLYAWVTALAANAIEELEFTLPRRFLHAHPRTLRRWLFHVPADLYLSPTTLIVMLRPHHLGPLWAKLVAQTNRHPLRIPWLGDRRLLLALANVASPAIEEPAIAPSLAA